MSLLQRLGRILARPKVEVQIAGGLGNQMFQYAVGRRLSLMSGADLALSLGDRFQLEGAPKYGLDLFNVAATASDECAHDQPGGWTGAMRRLLPSLGKDPRVFSERSCWEFIPQSGSAELVGTRDLLFMPEVLAWRGDARLEGFWQDERYFADIGDVIRQDFTLKTDLGERNRAVLSRVRGGPSAFIHVRRGDYLAAHYVDLFGVCDIEYYRRGLEILRSRVGDPRIFVFSDDPTWAREQLARGADVEIVDWNGDHPAFDIALMQACQHAVIANSSFSWWGAWLGERPGRTVIAPRVWFKAVPEFQDVPPPRLIQV